MRKPYSEKAIFFTLPALFWYLIFMIGPLIAMFYISSLKWTYIIAKPEFQGLNNFRNLFTSEEFWTALRNSTVLVVTLLPLMIPLAFMVGYYLSLKPRFHRTLRVLMFTPGLISLSVTAMIFFATLTPPGLLNGILQSLGLGEQTNAWLGSSSTAFKSIWAINLWQGVGYTAVLITARLENLAQEVIEAAKLDGASHWNRMWRICWPMIYDYIGTMTMLQFLWTTFGGAGLIILLTNGGPGYATTTLGVLVYGKAFLEAQLGYSQAAGVILFFFGLIGMLLIRKFMRPKTDI